MSQPLEHALKTKRPIVTPKLAIMRTSFKKVKSQRSIEVTRSTNAETGSALYLQNGKAYEVQTSNEDRIAVMDYHQQRRRLRSRCQVYCWPISRERKVPEIPGRPK